MSKDIYNPDHYLNEAGYDLFEEWYIRYPFEVFRILMWCTAERYFRRYFNKNGLEDLRKGMRVVERLEEYEERYSNEKYDKFEDESYLPNQDMSSIYPPSTEDWVDQYARLKEEERKEYEERYSNDEYIRSILMDGVLYGLSEGDCIIVLDWFDKNYKCKDESYLDTDGDVEIFRTNYLKEIDVLEAVYKGLQDVLAEDSYFEPHAIVEELREAIYDRLDALEKSCEYYKWYDDSEGRK